nr:MFS transporter [Thermoleophilaceae bacterium]
AQAAARAAPPAAREAVAEAARRAFIDGLNEILIVAAVVAFVGGVLAFALVRSRDFVARQVRAPA